MSISDRLARLRSREPWDVLIIGGGATGLGCAVDAASRGHRTLLVEARDFAQGTSSRSTKLIHGGVRYLAQGNVGLVREALFERDALYRNAPHLVAERPFVVPCYSRWSMFKYGVGLALYDRLGRSVETTPSKRVGRDETLRMLPTLRPDGLRGGIVYYDGQFDDARLAIALARTAEEQGATVANYAEVVALRTQDPARKYVTIKDGETGEEFPVETRAVINATGVFVDDLRRMERSAAPPMVRPSRGAHVVLDRSFLPGSAALLIPKTDDGRVLFAIPWNDRLLVGTTDTPVEKPSVDPSASEAEVGFLLNHVGRHLNRRPERDEVKSVFAGLRPLLGGRAGGRTSSLSREHAIEVSPQGLITISGGKWTTYRKMAEDAVDRLTEAAGLPRRPCLTAQMPLHGWTTHPGEGIDARFGSDRIELDRLAADDPSLLEPLHPALPYRRSEVVWSVRREWARTVEDVLSRRTRALLLDARAAEEAAETVALLMSAELGRDEEWRRAQVEAFRDLARRRR